MARRTSIDPPSASAASHRPPSPSKPVIRAETIVGRGTEGPRDQQVVVGVVAVHVAEHPGERGIVENVGHLHSLRTAVTLTAPRVCLNSYARSSGGEMRARPRRRRTAAAMLVAARARGHRLAGCSADAARRAGSARRRPMAPSLTTRPQQLQDAVDFAMAATGSSGAIVGVWAPWSGSWVAGVGTQRRRCRGRRHPRHAVPRGQDHAGDDVRRAVRRRRRGEA